MQSTQAPAKPSATKNEPNATASLFDFLGGDKGKIIALCVLVVLALVITSFYTVPVLTFSQSNEKVERLILCSKCPHKEMKYVSRNSLLSCKCSKCGQPAGLARQCEKCGFQFAYTPPPPNDTEACKPENVAKLQLCPNCGSDKTLTCTK